jgi:hypothetical protein
MRNIVARIAFRGAATVGVTAAALAVFGSGIASADALVGKTYAQAESAIGEWGAESVVATVVGSRLPQEDCLVTSWHKDSNDKGKVLVSLNCNAAYASAGSAGNSAASPEGRAARKAELAAEWRGTDEGHQWCMQTLQAHPDWGQFDGCQYD